MAPGCPQPHEPDRAEPRLRILSTAVLMLPSLATIRLTITIIAGRAQKSPHTHKIAAPIC